MAAPREERKIVVNGRVHEVTRVDEDGGFYTRHDPADGSGPTTHYWSAGTDWESTTAPVYTLHPFGDEWLWAEGGEKPLEVSWEKVVEVAEADRADMLRNADKNNDDGLRELAECMWFVVHQFDPSDPDWTADHLAALIGPDGTRFDYDDPRCLAIYNRIGSDGEWPEPITEAN